MASKRYWQKTPQEPHWKGDIPDLPSTGDADLDAMRDLYLKKMKELRTLRIKIRGTPTGVSMPDYSLEDFWNNPQIIDYYIAIDKWKIENNKK